MKVRRATGFAALAYIISMIAGIMISSTAGIDITSAANPPIWLCVASATVAVLFCFIFALLYFHPKKVKKGALYGFYFGLYMVIVGFLLDVIVRAAVYPGGATAEGMKNLMQYYSMPYYWTTFVLVLAVSTLTGAYIHKRK